jgi:hypothetical protein
MKPSSRILVVAGALLVLVLALLGVLPVLFADEIESRVKSQVNRSLLARVDWRDAGLGFFRNFPNLTLRLDDLTAVGVGKFERDTLASIGQLRVVLDLATAVRSAMGSSSPIVVRAVELDRPRLSLVALEDGTANWDVTRKDTTKAREPESARPIAVSLRRLAIDNGSVALDNRAAKLKALVLGLNQTLTGDFGNDQVAVETRAHADSVTVEFAGIPYLSRTRLDLTVDAAADLGKKTFALKEGSGVRLNDLLLAISGSVAKTGENLGLDLAFGAPRTDFKHLLSLLPAVYAKDFQSVQTTGSLALSGRIKGDYGEKAFPSFSLRTKVDNATFRYPDLPLPARDIFFDLGISNPGGAADSTVVNLSRLHLVLGKNPIDAALVLRTPISDPDVDARMKGTVDLADLRRTVKLDKVKELTGSIATDAAVRTRMSWVDKGEYDRVAARGTVNIRDFAVKSEAIPRPLAIQEASLQLAPRRVELKSFTGTVGSSDLKASGYLDNLLGYLLRDDDLRGSANLSSGKFDLNEWRSEGELSIIPVPPHIDFALEAQVGRLLYDKLTMTNAQGRLRVKDQRLTLENFTVNTLGGDIGVSGFYETVVPTKPAFDVGLKLDKLDIASAVEQLTTVRLLAPVARYAQGNFSADLRVNGGLGKDMMPLYQQLAGKGNLKTSKVQIRDFPALEKIAAATKLDFLNDPAIVGLKSQFEIRNGRLYTQPFSLPVAGTTMTVSGSNGLDQSLDYVIGLRVPRSMLGAEANQALAGLLSKAAGAGINLQAAPEIPLGIRLIGTVTNPSISLEIAKGAGSVTQAAGQALQEAAEQRAAAVVDSAKLKAAAEAQRLVGEAEKQAASIRAEAQALADKVKAQGYQQADSLEARAGTPIEKIAATAAADRLRKEADSKSAQIVQEADARANALVAEARKQAGAATP